MIPACPSLVCSFNGGNIKQSNSSDICLMFVYARLVLCLRSDLFCGLT